MTRAGWRRSARDSAQSSYGETLDTGSERRSRAMKSRAISCCGSSWPCWLSCRWCWPSSHRRRAEALAELVLKANRQASASTPAHDHAPRYLIGSPRAEARRCGSSEARWSGYAGRFILTIVGSRRALALRRCPGHAYRRPDRRDHPARSRALSLLARSRPSPGQAPRTAGSSPAQPSAAGNPTAVAAPTQPVLKPEDFPSPGRSDDLPRRRLRLKGGPTTVATPSTPAAARRSATRAHVLADRSGRAEGSRISCRPRLAYITDHAYMYVADDVTVSSSRPEGLGRHVREADLPAAPQVLRQRAESRASTTTSTSRS